MIRIHTSKYFRLKQLKQPQTTLQTSKDSGLRRFLQNRSGVRKYKKKSFWVIFADK